MASRTQLRTEQITGSFGDFPGGITDTRGAGSVTLANIDIATGSMTGILSEIASAIKRLHGAGSFTVNTAGQFSQTIAPATDDGASLGSANNNWSDLFLADSSVINFGDNQDVTLTHVHDTGLRLSGMLDVNGGTSGAIIRFQETDANGSGYVELEGALAINTNHKIRLPAAEASAAGQLLTVQAVGSNISQLYFETPGELITKAIRIMTGSGMPKGESISIATADITAGSQVTGMSTAESQGKALDVYVNGALLVSGSEAERSAGTRDYVIASGTTLTLAFNLEADDIVQVIKR